MLHAFHFEILHTNSTIQNQSMPFCLYGHLGLNKRIYDFEFKVERIFYLKSFFSLRIFNIVKQSIKLIYLFHIPKLGEFWDVTCRRLIFSVSRELMDMCIPLITTQNIHWNYP